MSTTAIDKTTGLPELPEGMFWRVTYKGYDPYMGIGRKGYYVQLQKSYTKSVKKHWWSYRKEVIESKTVVERQVLNTKPPTLQAAEELTPKLIRDTAATVLARYRELLKEQAAKKAAALLLGDYPPKQLAA